MHIKLNFEGINFPDEVQKKMLEQVSQTESKLYVDTITNKASYYAEILERTKRAVKKMSKAIWSDNEIAFLQHGTTKRDVKIFALHLFADTFEAAMHELNNDIAKTIKEDVTDEMKST